MLGERVIPYISAGVGRAKERESFPSAMQKVFPGTASSSSSGSGLQLVALLPPVQEMKWQLRLGAGLSRGRDGWRRERRGADPGCLVRRDFGGGGGARPNCFLPLQLLHPISHKVQSWWVALGSSLGNQENLSGREAFGCRVGRGCGASAWRAEGPWCFQFFF